MSRRDFAEAAGTQMPLLRIIRTVGRPNLPYFLLGIVGTTVGTFASYADIYLIGLAIDAIFNQQAFSVPLLSESLLPESQMGLLFQTVIFLIAFKAADIIATMCGRFGFNVFAQRVLHDLRVETFDTAQRLGIEFFDTNESGDVMNVLNDDINKLEEFLTFSIRHTIWIVASLSASMIFMLELNVQLAFVVLVASPLFAGINYWFSQELEKRQDIVRAKAGSLNAQLKTSLSGIYQIKSSNAEAFETERVEQASDDHLQARWDDRRIYARQRPLMRLLSGAWLLLILVIGFYWIVVEPPMFFEGTLTAGQLIPFLIYMQRLTKPMQDFGWILEKYKEAKASAKRILGISRGDEYTPTQAEFDPSIPITQGSVEWNNVQFRYPGSSEQALTDISMSVDAGETIGIVGTTGAGKSTLTKLLLKFYVPDSGRIRVDGHDLDDIAPATLRSAVGYVSQDPYLFDRSIRENITYSYPEATDEEIKAAAKTAGIHDFVGRLPDGYHTNVGEHGEKLSGGQKQRIAIARAILQDPPLMILDEATSHVDNETESFIQRNLEELTANRTTFIIAHRISTVRTADRIFVLKDGMIREKGDHTDLLAQEGVYTDLWNIQVGDVQSVTEDSRSIDSQL
ncbi:ABC transporter ATP-binding protein [Natrinema halophilum]|uniref:ABC transporter ATP-binding protein n=1 Tax=Natrinema halophilum TaxID=1699371 RepID=A0A7D5H3L5_9EURY|nr:ABC transporter ATP-binding protein [Natrinema halophilum]QLG49951.1 ABC transporter ATP-binding protein/permease [Natrinema halophilum]